MTTDRETRVMELARLVRPASSDLAEAAQRRLDRLTKPQGSLGRLEAFAKALVCIAGTTDIRVRRKVIFTFAADHGVAEEGVSLYPRSVTAQMVLNFLNGGAAVNVLARQAGADVRVIDAGTLTPIDHPALIRKRLGAGTRNFMKEDAMTRETAAEAILAGADVFTAEDQRERIDLAGVGDMGIGNTTSAAAVLSTLLDLPVDRIAGRGTGLDDAGLQRKMRILNESLSRRRPDAGDPLDVLAKVGGFEIGEMAGCFLAGASRRTPMLVDGFISTAAAALAIHLSPAARDYFFYSHCSAEGGHSRALQAMGAGPILDFNMRLGEGTGAALAMPVLSSACAMFTEMATFESAGVDDEVSH